MGLSSNTGFFNRAAAIYGDDTNSVALPRLKFNFSVYMQTIQFQSEFQFEKVVSVSMPDYQYNVTRLNQYNHQRFVTTRQEITPATIVFYDTRDNEFQNMLNAYSSHYYSQSLQLPASAITNNAATSNVNTGFGVNPIDAGSRFFFPLIRIENNDEPGGTREVHLINCMISNVSHDTMSHSDSSPIMWTVQFQPEHVNLLAPIQTANTIAP